MTQQQNVRPVTSQHRATEPEIAAAYKVLKFIETNFGHGKDSDWQALGTVRYMLGQGRMQMDDVTYSQMREYINEFAERRGI